MIPKPAGEAGRGNERGYNLEVESRLKPQQLKKLKVCLFNSETVTDPDL